MYPTLLHLNATEYPLILMLLGVQGYKNTLQDILALLRGWTSELFPVFTITDQLPWTNRSALYHNLRTRRGSNTVSSLCMHVRGSLGSVLERRVSVWLQDARISDLISCFCLECHLNYHWLGDWNNKCSFLTGLEPRYLRSEIQPGQVLARSLLQAANSQPLTAAPAKKKMS